MAWWKRKSRGPKSTTAENRREVPKGVWSKCKGCGEIQAESELRSNLGVCQHCDHHHTMSAHSRLELLLDPGSFEELGQDLEPLDPLEFKDSK